MRKIRIAQIGTGHDHAQQLMCCLRRLSDRYEIVGIAEPNPDFLYRLNTDPVYQGIPHYELEELLMLPNLDAVAVEMDEKNAADIALLCIERGLPIHLDKPGAESLSKFKKIMEKASEKKLIVQMGYMYRYNPLVRKALQMKEEGMLGEIYSVEAHMSVWHNQKKREWLSSFQGGMMYFLGCHLIDLILLFMGKPKEIIGFHCCTETENEIKYEDYSMAVLKYQNGLSFAKTCAAEVNGFARRQLVICGSKGTFEINPFEEKVAAPDPERNTQMISRGRLTLQSEGTISWYDCSKELVSSTFNRYDDMMKDFARMVLGKMDNPWSYEYETEVFRSILKACGRGEN
jgi:oxidoreductase domain protein